MLHVTVQFCTKTGFDVRTRPDVLKVRNFPSNQLVGN